MEYIGFLGFLVGAFALYWIDRLEKELKRRETLDQNFSSEAKKNGSDNPCAFPDGFQPRLKF